VQVTANIKVALGWAQFKDDSTEANAKREYWSCK
jgi:hypothetical protein